MRHISADTHLLVLFFLFLLFFEFFLLLHLKEVFFLEGCRQKRIKLILRILAVHVVDLLLTFLLSHLLFFLLSTNELILRDEGFLLHLSVIGVRKLQRLLLYIGFFGRITTILVLLLQALLLPHSSRLELVRVLHLGYPVHDIKHIFLLIGHAEPQVNYVLELILLLL